MARLKRPSNHPDVIREATERAAATVQPSTHCRCSPIRAASPLRNPPSLSPSLQPSSSSIYSSSGTEFDAPPPVEIETEQPFYSESTSAAASSSSNTLLATSASQIQEDSEISERRARYIQRVATQREARKKNPPPRRPRTRYCQYCKRALSGHQHYRTHIIGAPYAPAVQRVLHEGRVNRTCVQCNKTFTTVHNYTVHCRSTRHHVKLRLLREIRKHN